jgi:hypothetical protein
MPRKSAATTAPKSGKPRGKPFQPGQSGNPAGRPKGSRNKLSEDFISALSDDFAEHGISAIKKVRNEKPDAYLRLVADLVPKDVEINPGEGFAALFALVGSGRADSVLRASI